MREQPAGRPAARAARPHERCPASLGGYSGQKRRRRDLADDEAAVDACLGTRRDQRLEALGRRAGDRHEHLVDLQLAEQLLDVVEAAVDRDAVDPPPAQRGLSSRKPTTLRRRRLGSSRTSARPGAAGADDRAPAVRGVRALPSPGRSRSARREAATSVMQSSASTTKISSGKSTSGRVARTIAIVSGAESTTRGADREQVARGREAPDPPVDPEEDEEDVADAEQDRQRGEKDRALV